MPKYDVRFITIKSSISTFYQLTLLIGLLYRWKLMSGGLMETLKSFKLLGTYFVEDYGPKLGGGEKLKAFVTIEMMCTIRSVSLGVKRLVHEIELIPSGNLWYRT